MGLAGERARSHFRKQAASTQLNVRERGVAGKDGTGGRWRQGRGRQAVLVCPMRAAAREQDLMMQQSVPGSGQGLGPWDQLLIERRAALPFTRRKGPAWGGVYIVDGVRQACSVPLAVPTCAAHPRYAVPWLLSCCFAELFVQFHFFSLLRLGILDTDLFTCLSPLLNWYLFNKSSCLCISRHSSVFGKS